jgi:hypothetical protein
MVNLSADDLSKLETSFINAERLEDYKKWLEDLNAKQADSKDKLRESLKNINPPSRPFKVEEEEDDTPPYPLKFADTTGDNQLLNEWLDKTLANLESGSKPLAVMESFTGIALLEGKLMSLVMTVLNGVLSDDDLKNMTIYGVKSFATTRFAKLFFDDFDNMMPVMEKMGNPVEVLQIVDKLREAMANPEGNKPKPKKKVDDISTDDMVKTLNEWYAKDEDTKRFLTNYIKELVADATQAENAGPEVDAEEEGAKSAEEEGSDGEGANGEGANGEGTQGEGTQGEGTQGEVKVDATSDDKGDNVKGASPEIDAEGEQSAIAKVQEQTATSKKVVPRASSFNLPSLRSAFSSGDTSKEKPKSFFSRLSPKSSPKPVESGVELRNFQGQLGGTRRRAAPSQALTRKRWFELTLRDVLSETQ